MTNHYAFYDALSITIKLSKSLNNLDKPEIHLFAFLSCILSLYRGQPASVWGYSFAVTQHGYPYSPELANEIERAVNKGLINYDNISIHVTQFGKERFETLKLFYLYSQREEFLTGSTLTALTLPLGTIYSSISEGTEIKNAVILSQNRQLLSQVGQDNLYQQFADLSAAIGIDVNDLVIPAFVWLSYFTEIPQNLFRTLQ